MELHQTKTICTRNETIDNMKSQSMESEKKIANHLSDQGLIGTHTTMSKQQTTNNGQKP